jgi:hypothetical protein
MPVKCHHRFRSGSFCHRTASPGTPFCGYHQGSRATIASVEGAELHPLARLTTPEDVWDLLRETLNAARLGRISAAQARAVHHLAREWRAYYALLSERQREKALHRQILPTLMLEESRSDAELAEAPHPLPVSADGRAVDEHYSKQPIWPPLEPVSSYPGWIEREGRRAGDRKPNGRPEAGDTTAAPTARPTPEEVAAVPRSDNGRGDALPAGNTG